MCPSPTPSPTPPPRDESPESPGEVELAAGVSVPGSVLRFTFVSSGGPGGQNVNKKATKAVLRVGVDDLRLRPPVRSRLLGLAGAYLTVENELVITNDEFRSQGRNRAACVERLRELVVRATVVPKKRKATKPTKGSKLRRLDEKRRRGEAKARRRPGDA